MRVLKAETLVSSLHLYPYSTLSHLSHQLTKNNVDKFKVNVQRDPTSLGPVTITYNLWTELCVSTWVGTVLIVTVKTTYLNVLP